MKTVHACLAAATFLLTPGCVDGAVGSGPVPPMFSDETSEPDWLQVTGAVNMGGLPGTVLDDATSDETTAWILEAINFADRALGTTDDWRTAETNVSQLLGSADAEQNPLMERLVVVGLLRAHLLPASTPDVLGDVQHYTQRLIDMESEETETVAAGLERLEGHVSAQDLAHMATQAVAVGERWQATCGSCDQGVRGDIDENKMRMAPERFDRTSSMAALRATARVER